MALVLTEPHLGFLRTQGEQAYPQECCGFLMGTAEGIHRRVAHLQPAINERRGEDGVHRFLISADGYRLADEAARAQGLDIIGFYHSHPDADPAPSA